MLIQKNTNTLTHWLFKRPLIFASISFVVSILATAITALISSWLNLGEQLSVEFWGVLMIASLIITAYLTIIKKLPHEDMSQSDFVAITNGCSLITIAVPLLTMLVTGTNSEVLKQKLLYLYVMNPTLIYILAIICILLYLYIAGVAIAGLYAKYKRARTMGISKWKVILSWPFGFLLSWVPGYVIKGKSVKSNLTIKSKWFTNFNKWTLLNTSNTWFVFLLLLLLSQTIAGIPALVLTVMLLLYYGLWNLKLKSDLAKMLNRGYAFSAIMLNVIIIFLVLISKL